MTQKSAWLSTLLFRQLYSLIISRKVLPLLAVFVTITIVFQIFSTYRAIKPSQSYLKLLEKLPVFRDVYKHEAWPNISRDDSLNPDQVPSTVHYLWCGSKQFRFQHYLSVLSSVRLLMPLKIVFHYSHLPVVDSLWYNVWFQELKQSFASLELKPLDSAELCHSSRLGTALRFLSVHGGVFIGENVILTRIPADIIKKKPHGFVFSGTPFNLAEALIFAHGSLDQRAREEYMENDLSAVVDCLSIEAYNRFGPFSMPPCVLLQSNLYPKDVWSANTRFAELARWLYYGKRQIVQVQPSNTTFIPRVAHMIWLKRVNPREKNVPFLFYHFLSILSSLHVAKLRHVYVHGDLEPDGEWWERLKRENVTFVPIDTPEYVYQQWVGNPSHRSDIIRAHILQTNGGVYHDRDVLWVNSLPDWLLRYPTVVCPDWPRRGEWPAAFNMGILMAQQNAPWLRYFLSTLRLYLDKSWAYNAIMVPYKVYERHPDTLYVDKHLQVICYRANCHPTWHDDYIRDIHDPRPPSQFDWQEARAFHFTVPKPPNIRSLASPDGVRDGSDLYAKIARHILIASGRGSLIQG